VIGDLAVGGDRFLHRRFPYRREFNPELFQRRLRGNLEPTRVELALLAVLWSVGEVQSALCPLQVGLGDLGRHLELGDFWVFEWAVVDAVRLAPAERRRLGRQVFLTLHADRFWHAV